MDNIIPIVITLLFMAIWAFNLLFNKELNTPARPARPEGSPNFDPSSPQNANSYSSADPRVRIERDASGRYYIAVDQREEVARNERERSQNPQRGATGAQGKNRSKKKPGELTQTLSQNMNLASASGASSIQLTPLDRSKVAATTTGTKSSTQFALSNTLRETMHSLPKLREAILIREILGPPLARTSGMGRIPPAFRSSNSSNLAVQSGLPSSPANAEPLAWYELLTHFTCCH